MADFKKNGNPLDAKDQMRCEMERRVASRLKTHRPRTIYHSRVMKFFSMRPLYALLPLALLAGPGWLSAAAQTSPVPNPQLASKELNARVEALLKKMTLDEKVGQLTQYVVGVGEGPGGTGTNYEEMVAKGKVGSLMGVEGAEATNHYQHIAVEKSRLHIPIIFGRDVIHGHRTTFPVPLALAASWDPTAVETVARFGATEARADGLAWSLRPTLRYKEEFRANRYSFFSTQARITGPRDWTPHALRPFQRLPQFVMSRVRIDLHFPTRASASCSSE